MKISLVTLLFLTLFAPFSLTQSRHSKHGANNSQSNATFNVISYGAIGDGKTDDTQAFEEAWKETCKSASSSSTMVIPSGKTFSLSPVTFEGPCNSKDIYFQINGIIVGPGTIDKWDCPHNYCDEWIKFSKVNGLTINGSGMIDGQGSNWWDHCDSHKGCYQSPTGLKIKKCNNLRIRDISVINSPKMHIVVIESNLVSITNIKIEAPGNSPNTDGIHIQRSTNVSIDHSQIQTGDDCISIGAGSSNLQIWKIECGPGHGISIGSLGKDGQEESVENVDVSDVGFTGTTNGVRIKTWQGGRGYVRKIKFQRIRCTNVKHPIIIDQYYCDHATCTNQTSGVEISDITYRDVKGTSRKEEAITFACSETVPCTNIVANNISIQPTIHSHIAKSYCLNAHGVSHGQVIPKVPCFTHTSH